MSSTTSSETRIQTILINDRYEVRSDGRIFSLYYGSTPLKEPREVLGSKDTHGYTVLCLQSKYGAYTTRKCRLIAETFIPNPSHKPFIKHKDGNKENDSIDNLEWAHMKDFEGLERVEREQEKKRDVYVISRRGIPLHIMNGYNEIRETYFVGANSISNAIKNNKLIAKQYHVWKLERGDERLVDLRKLLYGDTE